MTRLLPLGALAALTLASGCVGGLTPRQSIYAAYGSYAAALSGAAEYAETPGASPDVVRRLNAANRSEPVQQAVRYGRAFTLCQGSNTTPSPAPGVDCSLWRFDSKTASGYAITLRAAVTSLLAR